MRRKVQTLRGFLARGNKLVANGNSRLTHNAVHNIVSCSHVRFIDYNEPCHNMHLHARIYRSLSQHGCTHMESGPGLISATHACTSSYIICKHITCVYVK